MTPSALKSLILAQPDGSPIRLAYAAGNDTETARLLNAKTQPGFASIRELSGYCVTRGITGGVLALDTIRIGETIAEGVPMTLQIKGLLKTVVTLIQDDYRLEEFDPADAAFGAACDGLISLGLLSAEQKTELTALGNNRRSIVEVEFGRSVTHEDIGKARAA